MASDTDSLGCECDVEYMKASLSPKAEIIGDDLYKFNNFVSMAKHEGYNTTCEKFGITFHKVGEMDGCEFFIGHRDGLFFAMTYGVDVSDDYDVNVDVDIQCFKNADFLDHI